MEVLILFFGMAKGGHAIGCTKMGGGSDRRFTAAPCENQSANNGA
jgi:hypothetical protein